MYNISRKYALSDLRLLCSYVKSFCIACTLFLRADNTQIGIHGHGEFLGKFQVCSARFVIATHSTRNMVPGRIPPSAVGITRSVQCIRIFDNNIPATVIISIWDLSSIYIPDSWIFGSDTIISLLQQVERILQQLSLQNKTIINYK